MMTLAPSSNNDNVNRNTDNEKVCDKTSTNEFRTIKPLVLNQQDNHSDKNNITEMFNRADHNVKERKHNVLNMLNKNTVTTLSFNQLNTRHLHQQARDGTMNEQYYRFQQSLDDVSSISSASSTRPRHSEKKSVLSIGASFNNHNRQSIHDNSSIQLPLIETHHPRPISKNSTSRKTMEPLGILPLKRRRNLFNYTIPSTPEDAKRDLLRLAGRDTSSKTNGSSPWIRTYSREESDTTTDQYEPLNTSLTTSLRLHNNPTVESTKPFSNRIQKGVLNCPSVTNRNVIEQPNRPLFGYNEKERAVIIIQSYWRGFHTRRVYKYLKKQKRAANVIASAWLTYSKLSKIRKQLKLTRHRQLQFFHLKQNELRDKWSHISSNRRIIVHIPSLGLAKRIRKKLNNLSVRENYQIGRLCELEDPNIDVIYVSPMSINDEISQYYDKLINLRAMVEQGNDQPTLSTSNNINKRFTIIVPEALHSFPGHNMCLATLLKYSPKALKQIKNLIKDRQSYLVTSISHIDDLYLSEYLDIPIYGCEPEVSYLYSTKSGSKRIFQSSNVPIPFGEYDIYDEKHLVKSLAQLIIEHLDIQRWVFKIDDHFDGLGIAYCDIAIYLPCYQDVLKEAEQFAENKAVQKNSYSKILSQLPDVLDKHTIYVNKAQFNSWQSYLKVFVSQGGIIEAYPPSDSITSITMCLSIEPDGRYSLICSGDQLHAESQFSCWGLAFPQSSVDPNQLNKLSSLIVEQCKQRHICGYIDIDFITFIDTKTDKQNLWVIDLSVGYSEHVSLFRVMRYITTGQFNPQTHSFIVKMKQAKQRLRNWQNGAPEYTITEKNRYAIWSSRLYHTNLSNLHYSVFFQMCRSHGVGFDIREKQGSIFTLLEGDHHEHIGMITISDTLQNTLSNFICYLNAIYQEITTKDMQGESNFMLAVNDIENILDITQDNASNVSLNTTTS